MLGLSFFSDIATFVISPFLPRSVKERIENGGLLVSKVLACLAFLAIAPALLGVWLGAGMASKEDIPTWYWIVGIVYFFVLVSVVLRAARMDGREEDE